MSSILSLETTFKERTFCLFSKELILSSIDNKLQEENNFCVSSSLFSSLNLLFKKSSFDISKIDVFLTTTGPGSFTGIRQSLAFMTGLKAAFPFKNFYSFSTLDLLMAYAKNQLQKKEIIIALSNGRFGYYVKKEGFDPVVLSKEAVENLSQCAEILSDDFPSSLPFPNDLSKILLKTYLETPDLFSTSLTPCYVHEPAYKKSYFPG
ncbi:MAG TPA: hypothetical protein VI959_00175 [Alphaproteobacteria bacterium]|nr:hypothetical protein [Alphaproteobacteria bacterium]